MKTMTNSRQTLEGRISTISGSSTFIICEANNCTIQLSVNRDKGLNLIYIDSFTAARPVLAGHTGLFEQFNSVDYQKS